MIMIEDRWQRVVGYPSVIATNDILSFNLAWKIILREGDCTRAKFADTPQSEPHERQKNDQCAWSNRARSVSFTRQSATAHTRTTQMWCSGRSTDSFLEGG